MKVEINRQLLGTEDLLLGVGTVEQTRGNSLVTITKINADNLPYDETTTIKAVIDNMSSTDGVATFTNKTLDSITNFIGANHIHYPVRNESGGPLTKGTVVTGQSTQSGTDYIEVVPVTNDQTQIALGILHTDLADNGTGLAINTGVCIDMVDTSAWAVGTLLYPNSAGGLTSTKPTTGWYQACAIVTRSHANQGTMLVEFTEPKYIASTTQSGYVQLNDTLTSTSTTEALTANQGKVLQDNKSDINHNHDAWYEPLNSNITKQGNTFNGASQLVQLDATSKLPAVDGSQLTNLPGAATALDGLSDVTLVTPANGQTLQYNSTTLQWENATPASGVTDHTLLTNIGTNTHAQIDTALTRLANTSGTNTGDQDLTTYVETTDYASSTVGGTLKARLDVTTLYLRNDGTNA